MTNAKKMLALILALVMALSVNVIAFAEEGIEAISETTDLTMETVNLGDFIKDKENWGTNQGHELTFKGGSIINENSTVTYLAYLQDGFSDKLVQYKQALKFKTESGGSTWGGLALRSSSYGVPSWGGNNGYLVVVKEDQIELQRWGKGGQAFLAVLPNNCIKDGVEHNISAGAINVEGGVNIFMFVDGVCIINVLDTDKNAITEGKYYDIYATAGSSISAYDGGAIPSVPAMATVSGKANAGEKFTADFAVVSFGEKADADYSINWYYSEDYSGKLSEFDEKAKKEFSKYEPVGEYTDLKEEGVAHEVKKEEIGGYYYVAIKDAKGNVVLKSSPAVVNNSSYVINNSVVLLIDCEYSFIKGKKVQIDPEDYNVMPAIVDSRTLVPVRFVAESFGAEVGWNGDTREVSIELDGKKILMQLDSKKYSVDGKEAELDVPAQAMANRTMVPVRVISEAFGKSVFWDGENELVIISDSDLGLDAETERGTLDYVFDQVQIRP